MRPVQLAGDNAAKTQKWCAFGHADTWILTPHQRSRSFALGPEGSASCMSQRFSISVKQMAQ